MTVDDGWYPDPTHRATDRYLENGGWTDRVRSASGAALTDPEAIPAGTPKPGEPSNNIGESSSSSAPVAVSARAPSEPDRKPIPVLKILGYSTLAYAAVGVAVFFARGASGGAVGFVGDVGTSAIAGCIFVFPVVLGIWALVRAVRSWGDREVSAASGLHEVERGLDPVGYGILTVAICALVVGAVVIVVTSRSGDSPTASRTQTSGAFPSTTAALTTSTTVGQGLRTQKSGQRQAAAWKGHAAGAAAESRYASETASTRLEWSSHLVAEPMENCDELLTCGLTPSAMLFHGYGQCAIVAERVASWDHLYRGDDALLDWQRPYIAVVAKAAHAHLCPGS